MLVDGERPADGKKSEDEADTVGQAGVTMEDGGGAAVDDWVAEREAI